MSRRLLSVALRRGFPVASRDLQVAGVIAALALLSGCQFRVPSVTEQEYLVEHGAFPSGTPDWVVAESPMNRRGDPVAGGFMSRSYTPEAPVGAGPVASAREADNSAGSYEVPSAERDRLAVERQSAATSVTSPVSAASDRARVDAAAANRVNAQPVARIEGAQNESVAAQVTGAAAAGSDAQPASEEHLAAGDGSGPLQRVTRLCPTVEKDVVKTLQLTDLAERTRSYEQLIVQCPASSELWAWLGKDYERGERGDKAVRCFRKAIALDPSNNEAKLSLAQHNRAVRQAEDANRAAREAELRRLDDEETDASVRALAARRRRHPSLLMATPPPAASDDRSAPGLGK